MTTIPKLDLDQMLIGTKDLAQMVDMTPRWVVQNRHRIIGAQRVGGRWKFNLALIRQAVAAGKNIVIS